MIDFSLNNLFPELGRNEFLEFFLKDEPVVLHDHPFVQEFKKLKYLSSVDSLIKSWPAEVNAYLKGTADEINSAPLSAQEAYELFQNEKSGLFFDDPNRFVPQFNEYLDQLRNELGLSALTYARSLIYLIPSGAGTAAHFDQNINFIFQISGTKKWWIAPNKTVTNPLERYTIGHEPEAELASYSHEHFPSEFPEEDAIEIELKPGSLLFLPRGAWHKTHASSEALSLNFTFSAPTWSDLMMAAMRSRLIQAPQWRETAKLLNDPLFGHHAEAQFDQLIQELAKDSQNWKACDILSATEYNQ